MSAPPRCSHTASGAHRNCTAGRARARSTPGAAAGRSPHTRGRGRTLRPPSSRFPLGKKQAPCPQKKAHGATARVRAARLGWARLGRRAPLPPRSPAPPPSVSPSLPPPGARPRRRPPRARSARVRAAPARRGGAAQPGGQGSWRQLAPPWGVCPAEVGSGVGFFPLFFLLFPFLPLLLARYPGVGYSTPAHPHLTRGKHHDVWLRNTGEKLWHLLWDGVGAVDPVLRAGASSPGCSQGLSPQSGGWAGLRPFCTNCSLDV